MLYAKQKKILKKYQLNWNSMEIETIIQQRLKLQSTIAMLSNDFGVKPDLKYICSKLFYDGKYSGWEQTKKNQFIVALGGKANFNKTRNFLEYNI